VENGALKMYIYTHELTNNRTFQMPSLYLSITVTEWKAQDCGISKEEKDTSMLPSKIDHADDEISGDRK